MNQLIGAGHLAFVNHALSVVLFKDTSSSEVALIKGESLMQRALSDISQTVTRETKIAFILVVISGLLVFPNLGKTCLWEDEAHTAVVAWNILKTGLPLASTGKNFVSITADHSDIRDNIYIWQPWLPNYLAAGSMAIFGKNSFGARYPFAISFMILIPLSYLFFKRFEGQWKNQSIITAILLVVSIPLLLHSRQSRYYVLVPLFNILIVSAYLRFMAEPRLRYIIAIVIWSTALFNSFPPGAILIGLAIGIDLIRRRPGLKVWQLVSVGFLFCLILNLPVFIFCKMWNRQYGFQPGYSSFRVFGMYLLRYLITINNYFFPISVILAAGLFNLKRIGDFSWSKINDETILFIIICVTQVVGFSILSDYPFTRYLIGISPFILYLGAGLILSISCMLKQRLISWIIVLLIVSTNITNLVPLFFLRSTDLKNVQWSTAGVDGELITEGDVGFGFARGEVGALINMKFGYPLLEYVKSIIDPPKGPIDMIVGYLEKEASPNDHVKITYGDLPLMFHTDLFVISSTEVGPPAPEWLINRHFNPIILDSDFNGAKSNFHYTKVELPVGDVQWNNQPDPLYHFNTTPTNDMVPFVKILKRID